MRIIILSIIFSITLNLAYGGEVIQLEAESLKDIIIKEKKEKIIVFFTTWCSYCKPIVLAKDLPQDKMIFISVDVDKDAIKNLAKKMLYNVYHLLPTDDKMNLVTLSQSLGIKFATINLQGEVSSYFPYIAFLDNNNKVIAETTEIDYLEKYLN